MFLIKNFLTQHCTGLSDSPVFAAIPLLDLFNHCTFGLSVRFLVKFSWTHSGCTCWGMVRGMMGKYVMEEHTFSLWMAANH